MAVAEADGNRTRLTEMLGYYGFEDRARHLTRYASISGNGQMVPHVVPKNPLPGSKRPWSTHEERATHAP